MECLGLANHPIGYPCRVIRRWGGMVLLAFLVGLAVSRVDPVRADEVVLVADPWCPYNCEPGSDREGFMVDIARSILEREGHHVVYRTVNWARAIRGARDGRWDGIIGALPTEAPDFIFPRMPLGMSRNVFYLRADDPWRYAGLDSLDGRLMATIKDYDYGSQAEAFRTHAQVDEQTGDDALRLNFLKLWSGRVDMVLAERSVADHLLDRLKDTGKARPTRVERPPGPAVPLYVAFSPANPKAQALADTLDAGMARLRVNAVLDRILARYGARDWEKTTAAYE